MRDWRDELAKRYPSLYRNYKGDPRKSTLAFGLSVGDGWREIIENLSRDISKIDKYNLVVVEQVKEKFGTLRFYFYVKEHEEVDHRDLFNRVFALVAKTEEKSGEICEKCGAPGSLYGDERGWLKTLCDDCREGE